MDAFTGAILTIVAVFALFVALVVGWQQRLDARVQRSRRACV